MTELATVAVVAFTVNATDRYPTMNLRSLAFCALALPLSAFAGNTFTGVIAVPFHAQRSTAIVLVQPADYLCAKVSLSSRDKDPARQADDIQNATRLITSVVAKSPKLQIHDGPLRFNASYNTRNLAGSGYGSSSVFSSGGGPIAGTSVRVLYKLDGGRDDVFAGAGVIRKLLDELKLPGAATLQVSEITLAVEAPERQRERLLALIRESADAMRKTFDADNVSIGGLAGPVLVRQADDTNVELFIDYELSVSSGK